MTAVRTFYLAHKRLKPFIDFALREGWEMVRTRGGHLIFMKRGLPPIYTNATARDWCGIRNPLVQRCHADRTAGPGRREVGTDD